MVLMHPTWLTLPRRKLRLKFANVWCGSKASAVHLIARSFPRMFRRKFPMTAGSCAGSVVFRTVLPDRRCPACDISDSSAASRTVVASSARPSAAGSRLACRRSRLTAVHANIRLRQSPGWISLAGENRAEASIVMPVPEVRRARARHPHARICARVSASGACPWSNPSRRFRRLSEGSPRTVR